MKAVHAVKRITFDRTEANSGETLYVSVPTLNENEVLVPESLTLRFDIDLSGGHVNNFLVQNVTRALVDILVVKPLRNFHASAGKARSENMVP